MGSWGVWGKSFFLVFWDHWSGGPVECTKPSHSQSLTNFVANVYSQGIFALRTTIRNFITKTIRRRQWINFENNVDHPHPPLAKKILPKYATKWRIAWRKNPMKWTDFHREYGARTDFHNIQTPIFMAFESRFLYVGGGGGPQFPHSRLICLKIGGLFFRGASEFAFTIVFLQPLSTRTGGGGAENH